MMYEYGSRVPEHMFRGDIFGGGALFMGFGLLVVVGLLVWLFVSQRHAHVAPATHQQMYAGTPAPPPVAASTAVDGAEAIARERLARGEIDAEEFQRVVAALRSAR